RAGRNAPLLRRAAWRLNGDRRIVAWKTGTPLPGRNSRSAAMFRSLPRLLRPRLSSLECRVAPATFTVLNLNDSGPDSLRDALGKANANPGNDDIVFNSGLTGAVVLSTGELGITEAV